MNPLSIINLSLEVVYCSTTLSNDDSIRLKKDSSRNYTRGYGIGFVSYSHLVLLISGQMFEVTVALEFFDLNTA